MEPLEVSPLHPPNSAQSHLIAKDCAQTAFEDLQGWRCHDHHGQPVLTLTEKNCFLLFRGNVLCSPACGGHSGRQHDSLAYQSLAQS